MLYQIEKPFIFTLFGASGDLAKLKLFQALYAIAAQKRLPREYFIVGFARTPKTREQFQKEFADSIRKKEGKNVNETVLSDLVFHTHYFVGDYGSLESFASFRSFLRELAPGILLHLAYFSVPPAIFPNIVQHLAETKRAKEDLRLIIEKPFGASGESAEKLFYFVVRYFAEKQIYLLDHYLGKSSVQSILHLRHANRILNHMIRGPEIANIQITAFEDIGIGERVGYFENTGIIKDFIQSHLLQTLALVTMSIPITESVASIHRERYSILSAVHPPRSKKEIVIGQYAGYRTEKGVPKDSNTETFVALRLYIDRESWYNVPIYLRTGKRTSKKHTYVAIEFKKFAFQGKNESPNRVIIEIQPEPKVEIKLLNRVGESGVYREVTTTDSIACDIEGCLTDHAALILDAIKGDKTNFLSFPEIITTWRVTDAVINAIQKNKMKVERYADGTRGPASQDALTKLDGFSWYDVPV